MKRLLTISAICLSLGACATTSPQVTAAQGLAAAWASLDAVANTLDGLATSKVLTGKNALTAATDLQTATTALQDATTAFNAGNNTTAQQEVTTATVLIAQLITLSQNPSAQ